ncbi:hypothetical protein SAMN05421682_10649 [Chryseobacterium indoltheticum]|uniref:Uncharacterized protein n=1 Tax=Chryseobacterium indoltheticum TaxID=254 RepID=A0A381F4V4_9FLAO|nr:hypothetical protein SAMN05421682_10649 [Chryseobacterium indoltheticum]SUX41591.1 Uncharacterised protein [Chryseobacterium indoltheticum]
MFFDVEEFFWKGENSEKAFCADEFSFSTNTALMKDSVTFVQSLIVVMFYPFRSSFSNFNQIIKNSCIQNFADS